jgi:hypothetical protein
MLCPSLLSRMEKRDDAACPWVSGMNLRVFMGIARRTGPGQILQCRRPSTFTGKNMLAMKGRVGETFRTIAVFAKPTSADANLTTKSSRNTLSRHYPCHAVSSTPQGFVTSYHDDEREHSMPQYA